MEGILLKLARSHSLITKETSTVVVFPSSNILHLFLFVPIAASLVQEEATLTHLDDPHSSGLASMPSILANSDNLSSITFIRGKSHYDSPQLAPFCPCGLGGLDHLASGLASYMFAVQAAVQ